jgi:hypothetical protein
MATTELTIEQLRAILAKAQTDFAKAYWDWSQAPEDTAKQAAMDYARGAEQSAMAALNSEIQKKIGEGDLTLEKLKTNAPVILLPVRLETKIVKNEMLVRIYPDEIWVDMLQRALTPEEYESGVLFWQRKLLWDYWNPEDPNAQWPPPGGLPGRPKVLEADQEKTLWDRVVKKHGNRRGAWIVRATMPAMAGHDYSYFERYPNWPYSLHDRTAFLDVQRAPDQWSSPALAVLPDQWWVWGYRGKTIQKVRSQPVREPLQITTDPRAKADMFTPVVPGDDSHKIEAGLRWTINFESSNPEDFETAYQVGMGVKLSLAGHDKGPRGFEKIIVIGVKASMGTETTRAYLERLLDSHHYSRGMAFVPQGTPTNNTEAVATPYTRLDDDYDSFSVEWGEMALDQDGFSGTSDSADYSSLAVGPDSNALVLSHALGVKTVAFSSIREALDDEQRRAKLMNRLLFPATLGYMMDQVMENTFLQEHWTQAANFFESYVRGRGPLPAFRIGAVPYGVLPAVNLSHWKSDTYDELSDVQRVVCSYLVRKWASLLTAAAQKAPRLNRTLPSGTTNTTPEQELLRVLGMHASARSFYIRRCLSEYTLTSWLKDNFTAKLIDVVGIGSKTTNAGALAWLNLVGASPTRSQRAFRLVKYASALFTGPLIVPEGSTTVEEYLRRLTIETDSSNVWGLMDSEVPSDLNLGDAPPLLWSVARHSLLVRYMTAINHLDEVPIFSPYDLEEKGSQPALPDERDDANDEFDQWMSGGDPKLALSQLQNVSPAELERLFTETMDVVSHRFDAWATALASRRLDMLRGNETFSRYNVLGGFGWVENAKEETRAGVDQGGFIQAPSLAHANAAAILRDGYVAEQTNFPGIKAIDVSSARVRAARLMLDEIRGGQELGSVLGARFEKILHEENGVSAAVEVCMASLRKSFPLPTTNVDDVNGPVEVAIPHVVNGQSMLSFYLTHNRDLYPGFPNKSNAQKAVNSAAEAVALQMDAVADLVVSESVYQIAKGNTTAVTASGESLARGFRPADPQIARGQEGGVDVSQRVALMFAIDIANLPGPEAPPRRVAEAQLDRWVESRLGALSWTVEYSKSGGSLASVELQLSDLGLCALDLLALFEADQSGKLEGSVLAMRLIDAAKLGAGDTFSAIIENVRSVAQLGALARALSRVLTTARPLRSSDLVERARISEIEANDLFTGQAAMAVRARLAFEGLSADLDPSPRKALLALAKYIPNAYPPPSATDDQLATLLADMQAEQQRRISAATAAAAGTASEGWTVEQSTEILKAVFGREFVALPTFAPPFVDDLQASFDHDWATEDEVRRTLDKMAVSRDPMRAWRLLNATSHATSTQPDGAPVPIAPMHFGVAQLPMFENEPWVGRTMSDAVTSGRLSLIIGTIDDNFPFGNMPVYSGIVIDDWTERVPSKTVDVGVAFHSESPAAEAPQAVLIAVPPKIMESETEKWEWSMDELFAVVSQTLDLAKIRALDLSNIDEGQYLPATLMAYSNEIATVSTDFTRPRVGRGGSRT